MSTAEATPETTPVIIGIGEFTDRPADPSKALEPVDLMAEALRAAEADCGGGALGKLDSIELVPLVSWPYANPLSLMCQRLGINPKHQLNASVGGETPTRIVHEAAVRIARGEIGLAAIVGGESLSARNHARKAKVKLEWTPQVPREEAFEFPGSVFAMSPVAKALWITDPSEIYPLYEVASQHAWGQTPGQARAQSSALWARYAGVAAQNPYAWIRTAPDAETIATWTADNRPISWPYPKLTVANPSVNQAAAIIVASVAQARALGVPDDRMIHIWGGGLAKEPEDYLLRDGFDHSTAQAASLQKAVELVGGDAKAFDHMELYSCFPVVPKMALRTLGLDVDAATPTVTGGLTFFGGPMNNYMGHALCAMVRKLRAAPHEIGLLYGQGGFFNKHHTLVVSGRHAPQPLEQDFSVQDRADAARGPVPPLLTGYQGLATVETYTIPYGRDGEPLYGVVVARTPDGGRVMARVLADDAESMALLTSNAKSAIGTVGRVRTDTFGKPLWEAGEAKRPRKTPTFCVVERDGPLTVVTINRPETMNSLTGAANAEFAEIFDDFAADPDQWVAIVTGAGERAFSAGNDLKHTAKAIARGERHELPLTGFAGMTGRFDLDKPVIAAVNGAAMGGGFELALACDIIIASENAYFALPEPKVGVAALAGGLLRLPQQIPMKEAMGMILTGRRVSPQEGRTLGFVNEVTTPEELMAVARRWAAEIIACSPMSIRASKQIVRKGLETASVAEAYVEQYRYPAVRALNRSADIREGPRAFAEKRPPKWLGR